MANKKNKKQGDWSAGTEGKKMRPFELLEEDKPFNSSKSIGVPLGIPVSEEEYQKLKDASIKMELPPNENAQEDSTV